MSHAVNWAAVNAVLIVIWAFTGRRFPWFLFPLLGWGIFLAVHAARAFVPSGRHHKFVVSAVYHGSVNLFLIVTWAITGAGFPWFVFPLAASIAIVVSRAVGLVLDHDGDDHDDDQPRDHDRRRDRADLRAYRRKVQHDLGREHRGSISG